MDGKGRRFRRLAAVCSLIGLGVACNLVTGADGVELDGVGGNTSGTGTSSAANGPAASTASNGANASSADGSATSGSGSGDVVAASSSSG
jgi:hypothetical protein